MAIDFFDNNCHQDFTDIRFGLCDDVDIPPNPDTPAYAKAYQEEDWIAIVENNIGAAIRFTAIDHCVISVTTINPRPQACDGMLAFNSSLIFVELKERLGRGWWEEATEQLYETIKILHRVHETNRFIEKKAIVSNKAKPYFVVSNNTEKNRFEDSTGFTLVTTTTITID